ncbi:MAG: type I 3-dehydroquinate dehydratase [Clostridia bacterium]|nr:type I 3-dehydroquinate dehydratase [Clostridia bacterium]
MGNTAMLGGCRLGEGMTKICVPLMGGDMASLAAAARAAEAAGADLVELRIDSLSPMPTHRAAMDACCAVRAACSLPLLFTLRTQRDGGAGSADADAYESLLDAILFMQGCDAVDVELSVGEAAFRRIAAAAHQAGVTVVGSSHEFGLLRDPSRIAEWLARQRAYGADVCKAAVMAHTREEAFIIAACMAQAGDQLDAPYIGIVMGEYGVFSRTACACMGSCLTFGTAGQASAPGQMDARVLRSVLMAMEGPSPCAR